jgi:hypothetical protein
MARNFAGADDVWAITTYFNPRGYDRRRRAYTEFRRRLAVKLVTVEYSTTGDFVLEPGDADILVQVSGQSILWQKERLLNIGIRNLPDSARYVAWVDCDIVFLDALWPQRLKACLDEVPVAQCYSGFHDLARSETADDYDSAQNRLFNPSVARLLAEGNWPLPPSTQWVPRGVGLGLAWAARREVLDRHGLYDALIIGSGDRAMFAAGTGRFHDATEPLRLSPDQAEHYLAWAGPYHDTVQGRIGCVEGQILHLWHGATENRRYLERHQDLARLSFNPSRDIQIDASGCWEWTNTATPSLRSLLQSYFAARNEDG